MIRYLTESLYWVLFCLLAGWLLGHVAEAAEGVSL